MKGLVVSHLIAAVVGVVISAATAGLSVYGDVQGIKTSLARIETRLDALVTNKVASK